VEKTSGGRGSEVVGVCAGLSVGLDDADDARSIRMTMLHELESVWEGQNGHWECARSWEKRIKSVAGRASKSSRNWC
jgi:hypothetical protein